MNNLKRKELIYALVGLAFAAALVFAFGIDIGRREAVDLESMEVAEEDQGQDNPEDIASPAQSQPQANPSSAPLGGELTYEDALKKYAGLRIQFDPTCKAIPSQMSLKSGTEVMFDNRSSVTQTVSFDDQSFDIAPFNYTVVNLFISAPVLPYTVLMHCGNAKNVAQIFLQN